MGNMQMELGTVAPQRPLREGDIHLWVLDAHPEDACGAAGMVLSSANPSTRSQRAHYIAMFTGDEEELLEFHGMAGFDT